MEADRPSLSLTPTLGGQICSVYLENFMTYDEIEIRPGSHLNMIIGPNGTGKSTIVCAVFLGLGGKLKGSGRAETLSSYIKHGRTQSLIKIELYNPDGNNVEISRTITSENHSAFFVNGKSATVAKVNAIRAQFNIQIDNLCTFLPQEKVQEFAAMNAKQLLEETERTIGNGELLTKHEDLRSLRGVLASHEESKRQLEEQLATLTAKNERLSVKVKAIQEKQALCSRVTLLHQKKCWLQYHQLVEEKKEIDKDLKLAQNSMETKKLEIEKAAKEINAIEEKSKTQQDACLAAKREENGKRAVVEDRLERLHQRLDRFSDLEGTYKLKVADEERKKKELSRLKATVDKLSNDLKAFDQSNDRNLDLKQEDRSLNEELRAKHQEESQLSSRKLLFEEDVRSLNQELRNIGAERRLLESRRSHRLEYLKRQEPDVYESVKWLEENQNLFHGKVYNPMLLELNVTDPKMARVVESTIPYQDLLAFTVTYGEDLNVLVSNLRVKMKKRINIVTAETANCTQYQPNVPISQLKSYGFYAFVKDFISGPEPVLQYLCRSHRIHNIPVGSASVQSKADKIPSSIRKYFSDEHMFDVRVSAYSREKATTVKKLNDARFFTESVDDNQITALQKKTREVNDRLEKCRDSVQKMEQTFEKLQEEMDQLRRRRREIAGKLQDRDRVVDDLKQAQDNVQSFEKTLLNPKQLRMELDKEKKTLEVALMKLMADLQKAHQALEKAYEDRIRSTLLLKSCRIGIDVVQDRHEMAKDALRKVLDSMRVIEEKHREADVACKRARKVATEQTNGHSPGEKGFKPFEVQFRTLKDDVTELEKELEETKARADFLDGGSAQILIEFNKREEEIAKLKSDVEGILNGINNQTTAINTARQVWLNPVCELIESVNKTFGQYFAAMGCAGEVCLQVPEYENDFDGYGVKIRVKFRDEVPLQDLTRYFQSGGERAVTTAIYMLSLQHLTSVPFRFVDEINQGMDPANERRITELIIKLTSEESSSQYFFVTPKLLAGLKCPENMSVLCVYNGPGALKYSDWDVEKFLARAAGNIHERSVSP